MDNRSRGRLCAFTELFAECQLRSAAAASPGTAQARRAGLPKPEPGEGSARRSAAGAALIFKYGSIRQRSAVSVLTWRHGVGLFVPKPTRDLICHHSYGL